MQRVRRLRLERAARQIRMSEVRLIEIAIAAGYESHEAFTRAFAERFGVAPSVFRERPSLRVDGWRREQPKASAAAVTVRTVPSMRVSFMRHHGSYATVGETWAKMIAWLRLRHTGPLALYGICPDDPEVTPEEHLRFDACAVVDGGEPDSTAGVAELPGGTYAVGLHVGPYERLHETYLDVIGRWFPSSGFELAPEPVIEHYLNDPSCTDANDLRTEVRVRIAD